MTYAILRRMMLCKQRDAVQQQRERKDEEAKVAALEERLKRIEAK